MQISGSNKEILEEGSIYEKDTTGYIDPSRIKAALYLATQVAEESPKYMDNAILSERASRVNAWKTKLEKTTGRVNYWKTKLEKTTGKKYLTNLGYSDKPEKEGLFTSLLRKSKVDEKAAEEYKEMRDALLETAKSGIRPDLTVTKAENLIKHAEEKVEASLRES